VEVLFYIEQERLCELKVVRLIQIFAKLKVESFSLCRIILIRLLLCC